MEISKSTIQQFIERQDIGQFIEETCRQYGYEWEYEYVYCPVEDFIVEAQPHLQEQLKMLPQLSISEYLAQFGNSSSYVVCDEFETNTKLRYLDSEGDQIIEQVEITPVPYIRTESGSYLYPICFSGFDVPDCNNHVADYGDNSPSDFELNCIIGFYCGVKNILDYLDPKQFKKIRSIDKLQNFYVEANDHMFSFSDELKYKEEWRSLLDFWSNHQA